MARCRSQLFAEVLGAGAVCGEAMQLACEDVGRHSFSNASNVTGTCGACLKGYTERSGSNKTTLGLPVCKGDSD